MNTRVLIVESDSNLARRIQHKLCCENIQAEVATNRYNGLEAARRWRPDAIILDADLFDFDHERRCTLLRSDPQTAHIPLVVLTDLYNGQTMIESFPIGAELYRLSDNNLLEEVLVEMLHFMHVA